MRRILFACIFIGGILIQLVFCMPAVAANLKNTTTKKYRITGVVKDALGRPIKDAALSLQDANGKVVANVRSNDEGEFSVVRECARHLCGRGDQRRIQECDFDRRGFGDRVRLP